jgi:hypothetical protein
MGTVTQIPWRILADGLRAIPRGVSNVALPWNGER